VHLALANALAESDRLPEAVRHYEQALEVRRREDVPFKWALTKSNLGHALMLLGAEGDRESLQRAVACHRTALEVMTRREYPLDWIQTMLNLASTLSLNPGEDEKDDLRQALECFDEAFETSREHDAGKEREEQVVSERNAVIKRLVELE